MMAYWNHWNIGLIKQTLALIGATTLGACQDMLKGHWLIGFVIGVTIAHIGISALDSARRS